MFNKLKNIAVDATAKAKDVAWKASLAAGANIAAVNVDELKAKAVSAIEENADAFAKFFSESKLVDKLQNTAVKSKKVLSSKKVDVGFISKNLETRYPVKYEMELVNTAKDEALKRVAEANL